ncbi:hypothetical protein D9757_008620 [Collybiopsis confluens]|uniref:Fungal-type protein kinase domain-containing protein n=1 Tax=Collybiopsis confluens TaxID=2823264 RepID=A0A8H5MA30_9AGAR|nr:hypothetical protein D9757_008620 [Collybiopsis confluens]
MNADDSLNTIAPVSTPPPIQLEPDAHPNPKETPLKLRTTDSSAFRGGNLEQRRKTVLDDLDNMIPEVEVDWFFENVLPNPIKGFDALDVVKRLEEGEVITASGWKAFPLEPMADSRHEDKIFAELRTVFDTVIEATNSLYPGHTQHFCLSMVPNRPPSSERASKAEPDAIFLPSDIARALDADTKTASYSWYDIANPAEFKKNPESSISHRNKGQCIPDCQQFAVYNVRRPSSSFFFRLDGAKSRPSSMLMTVQNTHRLVHFFASIAFASPAELGWDPSIQYLPESSPARQYMITVDGQKFTTVKNLADYSADSLVSRATRVWLVKDEEAKELVLKDVWIDADRLPEHNIRENLLNDVKEKQGLEAYQALMNYMLTPHAFERMKTSGIDDTTLRMMNNQNPPTSSAFDLAIPTLVDPKSCSLHPSDSMSQSYLSGTPTHTVIQIESRDSSKPVVRLKYHYRIVFKEHGTDLYSEMSLHTVFKTLSDLVTALDIVHRSGWVHRDISCGNVYWLHNPIEGLPRGILGDFEYAKRRDDETEHEKRTGTSEFMAFEAAIRTFDHANITTALCENGGFPKLANFTHNPLHDLESVWWLLVYILFHRDDKAQVASNPEVRNYKAHALFKTGPRAIIRKQFMKNPANIDLENTGLASSLEPVVQVIRGLALALLVGYEKAEEKYTRIDQDSCLIHGRFLPQLTNDQTLEAIKDIHLTLVVPISSGKRKTLHDDSDVLDKRKPKKSNYIIILTAHEYFIAKLEKVPSKLRET